MKHHGPRQYKEQCLDRIEEPQGRSPDRIGRSRRSIQQETAVDGREAEPESITKHATHRAQEANIHRGRPGEHHPRQRKRQQWRCRRNTRGIEQETEQACATGQEKVQWQREAQGVGHEGEHADSEEIVRCRGRLLTKPSNEPAAPMH